MICAILHKGEEEVEVDVLEVVLEVAAPRRFGVAARVELELLEAELLPVQRVEVHGHARLDVGHGLGENKS